MKSSTRVLLVTCALLMSACATTHYEWNDYDDNLVRLYQKPETRAKYGKALQKTIEKGEKKNRVPPGIYAEYGYFLAEDGDLGGAATYYQRELARWPESVFLMKKVLGLSKNKTEKTDPPTTQN